MKKVIFEKFQKKIYLNCFAFCCRSDAGEIEDVVQV
jgi:hypothetical protein